MRRNGLLLGLLAIGLAGSSLGAGPAQATPVSVVPGDVSGRYGPPSVDLGVQVPGSPGSFEPGHGGDSGGSSGSGPAYPDLTFPGDLSRICNEPAPGWLCPQPAAPGAPEVPGGATPAGLAGQAVEQLVLPEPVPRHSPDVALPDGRRATLVGEHTWFWTEPSDWHPQTERVQVGPVWAEVTARPARLSMQPGLGEQTASCAGPGTPYEPAVPAHAASPDCDVVYQRSSAGEQLLRSGDVSSQQVPSSGQEVLGLRLTPGRYPAGGLAANDPIQVVPIDGGGSTTSAGSGSGSVSGPGFPARVVNVLGPDADGAVSVDVLITADRAEQASTAAAGSPLVRLLGPTP